MKTTKLFLLAVGAFAFTACAVDNTTKSGLCPADFDSEYNSQKTALYTLTNEAGMEVCITNFGGRIVSIMVPDKNGEFKDVVLGFDKVQDYFPENNATDFGAFIGRYANRINQGKITIDGVEYQLDKNNYGHCLHGGSRGWQYSVLDVVEADNSHISFKLVSPDGDGNFPGEVTTDLTYTLTEDNRILIDYEAVTTAPTVINLTNHSYFNLSGDPANCTILDDILYLNASNFTPVDDTFMTTGEIAPVEGTPFDFTTGKRIGDDIDADDVQISNGHGYDHNWVLDTEGDITKLAASVVNTNTGIKLSVYTDQPGIQVYCGNFLDSTVTGKKGVVYAYRTAICLESQHYPDTPNKPEWPSALLRPGEKYETHTIFAFSVE